MRGRGGGGLLLVRGPLRLRDHPASTSEEIAALAPDAELVAKLRGSPRHARTAVDGVYARFAFLAGRRPPEPAPDQVDPDPVGPGRRRFHLRHAVPSLEGADSTRRGYAFDVDKAKALLAHGGVFELRVGGPAPVIVDPQAFVAASGAVRTELKSSMSWRNVGRSGGEAMQLECTGQGIVYVQASEEKL